MHVRCDDVDISEIIHEELLRELPSGGTGLFAGFGGHERAVPSLPPRGNGWADTRGLPSRHQSRHRGSGQTGWGQTRPSCMKG